MLKWDPAFWSARDYWLLGAAILGFAALAILWGCLPKIPLGVTDEEAKSIDRKTTASAIALLVLTFLFAYFAGPQIYSAWWARH